MHDDDVDGLLRKYRPAAPSLAFEKSLLQSLDREILGATQPRTWPWAVAAAALLTITIGLHAVSRTPPAQVEPALDARRVQDLADDIGGPHARAMAEFIVRQEQRANAEVEQGRAEDVAREAVNR